MSRLNSISVGDDLPGLEKEPTRAQLFRYSATTWNSHRIHYDTEHAREEGHPDTLVQAHLHGAFAQELILDWLGTDGELRELSWQNVGPATPGDSLGVGATVTAVDADTGTVEFEVWTETDEQRCAEGAATVVLFES
jgi:hydroxyacyl-ACP dehydratase HTD2-like protein with hotdog domain